MNDLVDSKAKDFLTTSCRGHNPALLHPSKLFHEPWTISLQGLKQPSLNRQHCYETLFKPRIHRYWEDHHDTPIPSADAVDWAPSYRAIKRLPLGQKQWRWKFSTGCIGVGNQLFHRDHQSHSKCPLCQAPDEKVSHVLRCPDRNATARATAQLQHHLSETLEDLETEPVLSSAILDIVLSWRRGEIILPNNYALSIRSVILEQCRMGWDNFVLGRWCPSWRHHQASHYMDIGSRKSSLRWATALIHKLLLTSWDFWQYRNDRLHAHAGPRELAQHSSFNSDIDSEFALGSVTLVAASRHLIDSRSLGDLHQDSLDGKRQWLQSVRAARSAFAAMLGTPTPALTAQATSFRAWLGLSATIPSSS